MKNKIKKTNPAFKLRQLLPPLPGWSIRSGVVAKDAATKSAAAPHPASGAAPSTWVTTE